MTVVIRMKRSGRKNRPCYRISVAERRSPRDGRTLESIGLYDPIAPSKEKQLTLDAERARFWIAKGAQPSETVASILKREGVLESTDTGPRRRPGRKTPTKTSAARKAAKAARVEAKTARRAARVEAAAQARKAAKAAAEAEAGESEG